MKVLFLTHPEADYGEYFLYNGLCEALGVENIIDYPYKRSYHGEVHTYPRPWEGGATGCTAPFEFAKVRATREYSFQEVRDLCRSNTFDFVVVGSPRYGAVQAAKNLKSDFRTKKIVMHDGEDYTDIREDLSRPIGVNLYLKRELLTRTERTKNGARLRPFPFSCPLTVDQNCDKSLDVLCAVGDSHPVRGVAKQVVANLPNLRVLAGHWGWSRYIELIAVSRTAVAPRGHGWDTVRRWEIPAFDTLLLCERLQIVEDNPLHDGEHCVYYSGPDELQKKLLWWLERPDDLRRVALAGQKFVREHHTNVARARRLIEWVKEI